jgi:hypothetical protein
MSALVRVFHAFSTAVNLKHCTQSYETTLLFCDDACSTHLEEQFEAIIVTNQGNGEMAQ